MITNSHSQTRIQQRGIKSHVVRAILEEGDIEKYVGEGRIEISISNNKVTQLINQNRYPASKIEKAKNVSIILYENQIVTVFHKTKRRRYH